MMISIIKDKKQKILAVAFWLLLWQLLTLFVNNSILISSPVEVLKALGSLMMESGFWISILNTMLKITIGFSISLFAGVLFAILSWKIQWIKYLIDPLIVFIKTVPVASFVILALVWIDTKNLSIFISFLMGLPIIYSNTYLGIEQTDSKLLEMGKVFNISKRKKVEYIYFPKVLPYFLSAARLAIGLCWKSGIAAEVIGLPQNSIGASLYQSKILLETSDMFAWTLAIVIISIIFEKAIIFLAIFFEKRIGG